MSEFDAFDSEPPAQNTEEDPAAAFLAREQSELAGLEDDNVPQDNGGNLSVLICWFNGNNRSCSAHRSPVQKTA